MNPTVKSMIRPWVTEQEARNHLRISATEPEPTVISLSCREVRNLCCDVDSLVFWYEEHQKVLEGLRVLVQASYGSGSVIPTQAVNQLLEHVGMYVQPPDATEVPQ